jgi:hypothetical protein
VAPHDVLLHSTYDRIRWFGRSWTLPFIISFRANRRRSPPWSRNYFFWCLICLFLFDIYLAVAPALAQRRDLEIRRSDTGL